MGKGERAAGGGRRSTTTLVALALASIVAVGCAATTKSAGPVVHYVALGDSYASGEGNPPFDQGTNVSGANGNICHRSAKAYPHVLPVHDQVILVDRACSGARVADVLTNSRNPTEPPQLTWLDANTDIVTISIGGNDAGFQVIELCLVPKAPCMAANPILEKNLATLAQELPNLYGQLRQHAPKARILVVGYPEIFPDPATVKIEGCGMVNFRGLGINSADVTFLRQKEQELNTTIQAATQQAGVEFVDEDAAFAGHEVCTPSPWVYGFMPLDSRSSFHPTAAGQSAMAARVAAVLTHPPA
jgi:lysophospholipase L1-like esterase